MLPEQIRPTAIAPTQLPTPPAEALPGTEGLGRTIAEALAQVNDLERTEAAREQAAHESRVVLAGLGVRLWRAQLLTRELEAVPRRGWNPSRRPVALADIREIVAAVAGELATRFAAPGRAEPVSAKDAADEAGVLAEMAEIVERLRAEMMDLRRTTVPAAVHAATVEEASVLRELLDNLRREHAIAVRTLEDRSAADRLAAQMRLPIAPPPLGAPPEPARSDCLRPPVNRLADRPATGGLLSPPQPFHVDVVTAAAARAALGTGAVAVPTGAPPSAAATAATTTTTTVAVPAAVDPLPASHDAAPGLPPALEEFTPLPAAPGEQGTAGGGLSPAAGEEEHAPRTRRGLRLVWSEARGGTWLARALHDLAEVDPSAATDLALALLPALAPRVKDRLVFSVNVPEVACFRVTIDEGATTVEEFGAQVHGLGEFSIQASLGEFLDFACGAVRRRGAGMVVRGNRRRFHRLLRGVRTLTLADAARLEIPIDADLALLAVATSIGAEWTVGYSFTVGFDVLGPHGGSWLVTVADGQPVRVSADPGSVATCRLTLTEEVFLRFLCNRSLPTDRVPVVEGEKHVAVMLMRWMTRAQDQPHMVGPDRTQFARPSAAA